MPIPDEYQDVIVGLLRRTSEGKVCWTERDGKYRVAMDDYAFVIWAGDDDYSGAPFVAVGLESGKQLRDTFALDKGEDGFGMLMLLHSAARRNSRGVTTSLADLKARLDAGDQLGIPF